LRQVPWSQVSFQQQGAVGRPQNSSGSHTPLTRGLTPLSLQVHCEPLRQHCCKAAPHWAWQTPPPEVPAHFNPGSQPSPQHFCPCLPQVVDRQALARHSCPLEQHTPLHSSQFGTQALPDQCWPLGQQCPSEQPPPPGHEPPEQQICPVLPHEVQVPLRHSRFDPQLPLF
jgi:hypothetical protein